MGFNGIGWEGGSSYDIAALLTNKKESWLHYEPISRRWISPEGGYIPSCPGYKNQWTRCPLLSRMPYFHRAVRYCSLRYSTVRLYWCFHQAVQFGATYSAMFDLYSLNRLHTFYETYYSCRGWLKINREKILSWLAQRWGNSPKINFEQNYLPTALTWSHETLFTHSYPHGEQIRLNNHQRTNVFNLT